MVVTRSIFIASALWLAGCIPIGDAWIKFGGTVTDQSGHPVPGATLSIFVDGKPMQDGGVIQSDAQGHYKFFENSCPCDYDFRLDVTAAGFRPYSLRLPGKKANQLTQQEITLVRE